MAKDKKSFLIYCDIIKAIDHLTNEEKGILFQHLLEYVNDMNPILEDRLLLGCWKPIELQLKRDLIKYESIRERNANNGSLGGRPKKPKKPNGLIGNPTEPKKADTDNVTVNDTDKGIDNDEDKSNLYRKIDDIATDYKKNKRLIDVLINSKKSIFDSEAEIFNDLDEFVIYLKSSDQTVKQEKDFKTHFLNWKKKKSSAKKESTLEIN